MDPYRDRNDDALRVRLHRLKNKIQIRLQNRAKPKTRNLIRARHAAGARDAPPFYYMASRNAGIEGRNF